MSGNITIRDCISEPWAIPGTDITKPDQIELFNFAIGQLAEIGTRYGAEINTQSVITAEISEAVDTIQDRSTEVASKFDTWTQSADLGITSVPTLSSILNLPYNPTDPNNIVTKLSNATNILKGTDAFFDSSKLVTASFIPSDRGSAVSFVSSSQYLNQTVTYSTDVPPVVTPDTINDLVIYHKYISPGIYDSRLSVNYDGTTYTLNPVNINPLWLPVSTAEIESLKVALQSQNAVVNTAILLDKTQVLPTPSDLVDPATLPSDTKVTLEIIVGDMDGIRFKVSDQPAKYFYPGDKINTLK